MVFKGENECPGLKKGIFSISLHRICSKHCVLYQVFMKFSENLGGFLQKMRSSVKFLCPSEQIPQNVEVDLSKLDIGDQVLVKDLPVHSSLKLLSKIEDTVVCKVTALKPDAGPLAEND